MLQKACCLCKVVGIFAIIGALNWGVVGLSGTNLVEQVFGAGSGITRVIYIVVGLSGVALLVSFVTCCPKCKAK